MKINDVIKILVENTNKVLLKEELYPIRPSGDITKQLNFIKSDEFLSNVLRLATGRLNQLLHDKNEFAKAYSVLVQAIAIEKGYGLFRKSINDYNPKKIGELIDLIVSQNNNDYRIVFDSDEEIGFTADDTDTRLYAIKKNGSTDSRQTFFTLIKKLNRGGQQAFLYKLSEYIRLVGGGEYGEDWDLSQTNQRELFDALHKAPDIMITRIFNSVYSDETLRA